MASPSFPWPPKQMYPHSGNTQNDECISQQEYFFIQHLFGTLRKLDKKATVTSCPPPEREDGGSKPTAAVLCPWARHFTPRKYWLITQEAVAPSRYDWKIVDWDVKPQHKQTKHPALGTKRERNIYSLYGIQ